MSQSQSPQSTSQWKNAVIIGGLIGGSVLLGAILVKVLPGNDVASSTPAEPAVTAEAQAPAAAPVQEATTAPAAEAEPAAAQPAAAPKPTAAPQAAPAPAPEPRRPEIAAGANSTVSGEPGWKNIREGVGTQNKVVDTVEVGDRLQMLSSSRDSGGGVWYQVVTPKGRQGWIAGQLLTLDNANSAAGVGGNAPSYNPTNATVIGAAGSKNVRSGPSVNYPVAHIAYPGDRVMVSLSEFDGTDYVWYKVYFPISGAEGWMADVVLSLD
ncbi:MAG: SH3 domain-containing protein [Cyanobacteria bacterium J06632_22]